MLYIETVVETLLSAQFYSKYFMGLPFKKTVIKRVLNQIHDKYTSSFGEAALDPDKLSISIEETVKSYARDKRTAIAIAKKFIDFLEKEHSFHIDISYPPIDVSNSFERLMYISKELQMSSKTIEDLSDELWVSTRVLENDIAKLRGVEDPIQVCGKPFIIKDMTRSRGQFEFTSTVHPLFLTYNITQVMVTLKGLKHMCSDPLLESYALISAKSIWQQLSDYAKDRILYVIEHLLPDDKEWYLSLSETVDGHFQTEVQCSRTEGTGTLIDCIKNDKTCHIEYEADDGGSVFLEDCTFIPRSFRGGSMDIIQNGEQKAIEFDKVLRSAYTKEQLI